MNTKKTSEPAPMDASVREQKTGIAAANTQRPCYAIKTLVAEMLDLFPETPYEVSNYNGRNVGLDVVFDLSMIEGDDVAVAKELLVLTHTDIRVSHVYTDNSSQPSVRVSMKGSSRSQDSREPFGLADAWEVLTDGDEDGTWGGWDGTGEGYFATPDSLTFGGSL